MSHCLSTFTCHLHEGNRPLSQTDSPLPGLIPLVREPNQRRWNKIHKKKWKQRQEVEGKRKYLGANTFSLSSKIQTCAERAKKSRQERPLCARWSSQSPWQQWALLIRSIPLSSVNSPRQRGPYHSSCKQGRNAWTEAPLRASQRSLSLSQSKFFK